MGLLPAESGRRRATPCHQHPSLGFTVVSGFRVAEEWKNVLAIFADTQKVNTSQVHHTESQTRTGSRSEATLAMVPRPPHVGHT